MTRSWLIGSGADCDVVIERPTISGHHCRLTREPDAIVLEDLGSSSGTFVNGVRIAAQTRVTPDDAITLGPIVPMPWPSGGIPDGWKVLRIGREPENDFVVPLATVSGYHAQLLWDDRAGMATIEDLGSSNGTSLGGPDRKVTRAALAASETVFLGSHRVPAADLLARLVPARVPILAFHGRPMVVGRDASCDHVLDLPMVSGRHARLSSSGSQVLIEDLGSANGTFVGGRRIERAVAVVHGDRIGLGSYTVELAIDEPAASTATPPASKSAEHRPPAPSIAIVTPPPSQSPSPGWSEISHAFADSLNPPWRLLGLIALAPVAAGLIVLALPRPVRAAIDAGDEGGISHSIAARLFWLGFIAVGFGLSNAAFGIAHPPSSRARDRGPDRLARLVGRSAVLGLLSVAQCAIAMVVVHSGTGLKGPVPWMLGILILASAVGLLFGLALASLNPRPGLAIAILPLCLLPTWMLGGQWRPIATMAPISRRAADLLPTRWAFEGLLLLESRATATRSTEGPDLAEPYFPARTERMGLRAGMIALLSMMIGLAASAAFITGTKGAS